MEVGDALFIVGGTLPIVYIAWLGVSQMKPQAILEEPHDVLFSEIVEVERSQP